MPRTKDNYHNSKIFGIYNENNRLIYIGHTTINLQSHYDVIIRNRLMKLDVRAQIASYAYQNDMAIGWSIKLIQNYPCKERWQVEGVAQMLISKFKPIVNMQMRAADRFYQRTQIKRLTLQCPCCVSLDEQTV
jgi:hypothetical protein